MITGVRETGSPRHASVVGPDVDAVGLYVGHTHGRGTTSRSWWRGRIPVPVPISSSQCSAVCGTPELTMQDAVHSAQTEIRRAVRARRLRSCRWTGR